MMAVVNNAQPAKVFGSTHPFPPDQSVFAHIVCRIPVKSTSMFIKSCARASLEQVETHEKHW